MCEVYAANKWVSPAASTDTEGEAEEPGPSTGTRKTDPTITPKPSTTSGSIHYDQLLTMKVYKYVLLYHPRICRMSISKPPMVHMCMCACECCDEISNFI